MYVYEYSYLSPPACLACTCTCSCGNWRLAGWSWHWRDTSAVCGHSLSAPDSPTSSLLGRTNKSNAGTWSTIRSSFLLWVLHGQGSYWPVVSRPYHQVLILGALNLVRNLYVWVHINILHVHVHLHTCKYATTVCACSRWYLKQHDQQKQL